MEEEEEEVSLWMIVSVIFHSIFCCPCYPHHRCVLVIVLLKLTTHKQGDYFTTRCGRHVSGYLVVGASENFDFT